MSLNERSLSILDAIVEGYISSGEPMGSRTIAKRQKLSLSPATIRNVMADLEEMGYINSPHTSAGRVPTPKGYRFYVDTLLQVRNLSSRERQQMEQQCNLANMRTQDLLKRAGRLLSDMSNYTGIVLAPRFTSTTFRHIEFVPLSQQRLLVIFVSQSGVVQNKIITMEDSAPTAQELQQITNYLNESLGGLTIPEVRAKIVSQMQQEKALYDQMVGNALSFSQEVFNSDIEDDVIIEGVGNIFDQPEFSDTDRRKRLFNAFEQKNSLIKLLDKSQQAQGVQIYIGSQAEFQELDGCSLITANYSNGKQKLGSLGVIGPSRMEYSQVVAMVDYTAQLVSRALELES